MAQEWVVANTNLTDAQRQQVAAWVTEGLKLSDIQKRLETDFGLRLTYLEARFLLDDLKVVPKDPPPPPASALAPGASPGKPPGAQDKAKAGAREALPEAPLPGTGGVRLTVDQLAKPGAMVSGTVTFSDGQSGQWYMDEMGRLGLAMQQKGYRPSAADVEEFQILLQQEAARQGY
jgi:hypothetical protein